ncbi:hypothetical protein LZZ85_14615 [Terrimonas sp. NA20]|uniref:XRE family transcriptional regulator n=1 Tax=Terrimonas ginsenosidimutans TaxID=2908004 RepID=A0ABS9KT73_9BACT|nr:hypothetical protein [Terrimonas ginsenosidimutans]MCG2615530.1 hypothetical protein [Terrimonas ginsenosidimutans]
MEIKEKQYILLKWGLALKLIVEKNKTLVLHKKEQGIKDKNIINSFGRLEAASGIPKATLVNISLGRKNAASSTWTAILEALDLSMVDFGHVFDSINDKDILRYKEGLESARKERARAKNAKKKRTSG